MKTKISFVKIFKAATISFKDAFDVFHASLFKVFVYFVILNLLMLLPLSIQVLSIENFDFERFGMNFTTTEIPEWIPEDLPSSCVFENRELDCGIDVMFVYEMDVNGDLYQVYINASNDFESDDSYAVVFYQTYFKVIINDNPLTLGYGGLEGMDFGTLVEMEQSEAASILFEGIFQSVKNLVFLPIVLFSNGALFIMNLLLVVLLAALSMLFKLNQSNYPSYANMIKLFMIASTIPALINVILGFYGLSAFTSLTYNFITPFIALAMYKASRRKLLIHS